MLTVSAGGLRESDHCSRSNLGFKFFSPMGRYLRGCDLAHVDIRRVSYRCNGLQSGDF